MSRHSKKNHYVYILQCSDDSLYTGYAIDLDKRLKEHNGEGKNISTQGLGAKYTRGRRPVKLVYYKSFATRSEALQREYAIKQLKRIEKLDLIKNDS